MENNQLIREALAGMESQARTEKRAQRILHKIEGWDRDELAERYAWMLLLACELHKTTRALRKVSNLSDSRAGQVDQLLRRVAPLVEEAFKTRNDHKRGAAEKRERDPKQAKKKEAFKEWQDWQAGRTIHKNQSQFAQHIVRKFPILESPRTVENWSRQWRKAKAKK